MLRLPGFLFLASLFLISCGGNDKDLVQQESSDPKIAKLKMPEGFKAERLYSPGENEQGSWVSMTFDNKGRMIACDQFGSLYRLEIPPIGDSSKPKVERLDVDLGFAQGLLYAFNSLWVMVNHDGEEGLKRKGGLYRLQDKDGDDKFETMEHLKEMNGSGEHGPHSIILSPDKNSLFLIAGNHTDLPKFDTYRLPSNWKEDNLFPLIKDPSGHANDRTAPGGWIAHIDSTGKNWELYSAGYRNAFDIAFNDAGDLFAYDSDMEYDIGMPWYRPTRVCHVPSGSEFGWRTGNSKWSPAFPDNLPALLNIGQGSPTNLVYGGNAKFPPKYRKSLFAFDWSFGIIYAIQMEPDGASYKAKAEEFISGAPLPLTDGIIGPDGALYFLTGGRRLESDLYRVSYIGKDNTEDVKPTEISAENKLRRQLEEYHMPKQGAVDLAWPQLKNNDRFVRYAARIAIEHQPVNQWQDKVLNEKDPVTLIHASIALARQGKADVKNRLLQGLNAIDAGKLSSPQKVDLSRAYELVFLRMGLPEGQLKEETIATLEKSYPADENMVNRQYSKLLITLQAPDAVSKTMALLDNAKDDTAYQKAFTQSSDLIFRNPQYGLDIAEMLSKVPPAQQTYYATMLSAAKTGWTPELREKYFTWFKNASNYRGGKSFMGFIDRARKLALANVQKAEFAHFNTLSGDSIFKYAGPFVAKSGPQPKGPWREWKFDDALKVVDSGLTARNFENGKNMYNAVMCSSCHSIRGEGGQIGPDLTQLGTRFSPKDVLEAVIEPSKTISDQYAATIFYLKDGKSIVGRLIGQDNEKYSISQNPFAPQTLREIPKADVVRTKLSDVSIMMPGMINSLNGDELRDLMAFLMAGGNKDNELYSKK
ncbi:MAG: c-type cytochrome [Chitinophagaceae bacterium]|nr:c-type cytochrome [Chitinophagaceae bacterium]